MDMVTHGPYTAVVDYAHTPDSLEAAYRAMRELMEGKNGKLIAVLGGAGGGRDTWKRYEMGKIAAHYCDEVIITNEDPYDEDPMEIINEVASGIATMPYPKPEVIKVLDRREALERAVSMMQPGDMLITTGKGSEAWIHGARGKKIAWNEKEIVKSLLELKM
jgi:UDP-N-acetylmuramoyl-L-alanyl-D-glutamate--2,6-diaminopimelate ligase